MIEITISRAIAHEYQARDVWAHAEMAGFPQDAGTFQVDNETARAMLADAEFNCDRWGPDNSVGTKSAYRALVRAFRAKLG